MASPSTYPLAGAALSVTVPSPTVTTVSTSAPAAPSSWTTASG